MVNIKKSFDDSINFVIKNKILVIPFFISILSVLFFVLLGFFLIGGFKIIDTYSDSYSNYNKYLLIEKEKGTLFIKDFNTYLKENNNLVLFNEVKNSFNLKNLIVLIVLFTLYFILNSYLMNVGLYSISRVIKDGELTGNIYLDSLSYYFKYFLISVFLFLIYLIFFIIIFLSFLFFSINLFLGIIIFLITFLLAIIVLIYFNLRLLFVQIILYLDKVNENNCSNIIKNSFEFTKNKLKAVILVALVIYGITILINSIAGQPFFGSVFELLISINGTKSLILSLLISIFVIAYSFLTYFLEVFRFMSYLNFNADENNVDENKLNN